MHRTVSGSARVTDPVCGRCNAPFTLKTGLNGCGRLIGRASIWRRSAIDLEISKLTNFAADTAPARSLSRIFMAAPILRRIMMLVDCRESWRFISSEFEFVCWNRGKVP